MLGSVAYSLGEYAVAVTEQTRAVEAFGAAGYPRGRAIALMGLMMAMGATGATLADTQPLHEQALETLAPLAIRLSKPGSCTAPATARSGRVSIPSPWTTTTRLRHCSSVRDSRRRWARSTTVWGGSIALTGDRTPRCHINCGACAPRKTVGLVLAPAKPGRRRPDLPGARRHAKRPPLFHPGARHRRQSRFTAHPGHRARRMPSTR